MLTTERVQAVESIQAALGYLDVRFVQSRTGASGDVVDRGSGFVIAQVSICEAGSITCGAAGVLTVDELAYHVERRIDGNPDDGLIDQEEWEDLNE